MADRTEHAPMPGWSTCAVCGGLCDERAVSLALPSSASGYALLRNVPAEVCTICGETSFTLGTTERVLAAVRNGSQPDAVAVVPVYDLKRGM
ncbi:MAG TPA: hypothetical protein VLH79_00290 [Chthonomonadales bacterium]|nr:hypothetical protein [Chthonomonadales bacterium]